MKSETTLRKQERELRKLIDSREPKTEQEIVENRLAYLVETTLRWARLKTVGWESRTEDVKLNAKILLNELAKKPK